jgi:hypothetical protein
MICDISTHWNSTALMLECVLELREALKLLVVMEEHNKPRGVRLSQFKLSKEEWDLLAQLFPILNVHPGQFCTFTLAKFQYRSFSVLHEESHQIQLPFCITLFCYLISSLVNLMGL